MDFNEWWKGNPAEKFWLEVTDRNDVGADLNAPQLQDNGTEYYGYSLIQAINNDDIVFHYHKDQKAIVAWSRASGVAWQDQVIWGAHGTTARNAGVRPYVRPGWRLGLAGTAWLQPPVSLADLREHQDTIQSIRQVLDAQHRGALYFPFETSDNRDLRPTQAYLTKLPLDVVHVVPGLSSVERYLRTRSGVQENQSSYGLGTTYRPADETLAISERDPFAIDPALTERAVQGHAVTQNALASYLKGKGIDPRSPRPDEPNYDIAWVNADVVNVAEVKSLTLDNEEKQLRLGLGQVLRYRHVLSRGGRSVRALLITERQPTDTSWLALCRDLRIHLAWPDSFSTI